VTLAKGARVPTMSSTSSANPTRPNAKFSFTDKEAKAGKESYYYVRGEQADGELVWASPMWITYKP